MKTIIAVILFGVLIYPSHGKIEYGKGECQKYGSMVSFDPKKFFAGNWSLTYSTRSERVTESTINRDYVLTVQDNGNIDVTYGYNKNGCENHYEVHCNGTRNSEWDSEFNFDCHLRNDKEQDNVTHIDAYFIATDYDNYCVVYRCVKDDDDKFVEDNLFILFRPNKTDESYANTIVEHYGLKMEEFITRKNTTCPNSVGAEKKENVREGEEGALKEGEPAAQEEEEGNGVQKEEEDDEDVEEVEEDEGEEEEGLATGEQEPEGKK